VGQRERRADVRQERLEVGADGVARETGGAVEPALDVGIATRDAERRRLDHRQRGERQARCSDERDDAAVGVADQMIPRPHDALEPLRVGVEVDALDRRARREPGPVRQHDLEP
jgi:hypothetical protein